MTRPRACCREGATACLRVCCPGLQSWAPSPGVRASACSSSQAAGNQVCRPQKQKFQKIIKLHDLTLASLCPKIRLGQVNFSPFSNHVLMDLTSISDLIRHSECKKWYYVFAGQAYASGYLTLIMSSNQEANPGPHPDNQFSLPQTIFFVRKTFN